MVRTVSSDMSCMVATDSWTASASIGFINSSSSCSLATSSAVDSSWPANTPFTASHTASTATNISAAPSFLPSLPSPLLQPLLLSFPPYFLSPQARKVSRENATDRSRCKELIKVSWWSGQVSGWMFLLVPAHPGSPGQRAVKQLLLLLLTCSSTVPWHVMFSVFFSFVATITFVLCWSLKKILLIPDLLHPAVIVAPPVMLLLVLYHPRSGDCWAVFHWFSHLCI